MTHTEFTVCWTRGNDGIAHGELDGGSYSTFEEAAESLVSFASELMHIAETEEQKEDTLKGVFMIFSPNGDKHIAPVSDFYQIVA